MTLSPYNNKRILVTGGAGFIGSHLVDQLVAHGAHVTVLDNLSSGNMGNLSTSIDAIALLQGDVTNLDYCLKACAYVDTVFHLAALVSVQKSIDNPDLCHAINVQGTKNLLEACIKHNVHHFVFSSSAAVYGNQTKPCIESMPISPQSPYAESKIAGEQLCIHYAKKYGLNTVSLRYFNVYGRRQDKNSEYASVVAKFTTALKNRTSPVIYGNGKQTRDFVHVSDVVKANMLMGFTTNLIGEIFNTASGKSINLLELLEQLKHDENIEEIKPAPIIFKPAREGDIVHSAANCSKYQKFAFAKHDFTVEFKEIPPSKKNLTFPVLM